MSLEAPSRSCHPLTHHPDPDHGCLESIFRKAIPKALYSQQWVSFFTLLFQVLNIILSYHKVYDPVWMTS